MKQYYGDRLTVNWRYLSLEQINSTEGPDWKLWEQPESYESRGRLAFQAAEAARRQGQEAFERFHWSLLRLRHLEKMRLHEESTVIAAAQEAGLDVERLKKDLADPSLIKKLGQDHTEAVARHGVFGCPTFVFPSGRPAFVRFNPAPPPDEAVKSFESLWKVMAEMPYIDEIKRPTPPAKKEGG